MEGGRQNRPLFAGNAVTGERLPSGTSHVHKLTSSGTGGIFHICEQAPMNAT
jgi:hypothetical protein